MRASKKSKQREQVMLKKPRHKFNAKKTVNDGIKFDSKIEAAYYEKLKQDKEEGRVLFFLRQVPLHLPGKTKLVIDFQIFYSDGTVSFVDVKGMKTDTYKIKKREVEAEYPIEIEEVYKV